MRKLKNIRCFGVQRGQRTKYWDGYARNVIRQMTPETAIRERVVVSDLRSRRGILVGSKLGFEKFGTRVRSPRGFVLLVCRKVCMYLRDAAK